MNSRQKGKRSELELAHVLRDYGFNARRGIQYCGAFGDADVIGVPGIHIECKNRERLNLYDAMAQSVRDARSNELPCVFHRKNRCEWLVTMRLDDWMKMYRESGCLDGVEPFLSGSDSVGV